jgi:hypothetical protein
MPEYRVRVREHHGEVGGFWRLVRIERVILDVIQAGACLAPVRVRAGGRVVAVPCGRRVPARRQCANCRTVIVSVEVDDAAGGVA